MPDYTARLNLPKPLANEVVSRAAHNALVDAIDAGAAAQSQVDRPFYLKAATYDGGNNRLALTFGPGRAAFLGTIVDKTADSNYYINAPTASTNYYVYLKSDGSYTHNTTGATVVGGVAIWKVATGGSVSTLTVTDLRGELPGAAARLVQDGLDTQTGALNTHKTAGVLDHPDGSVTAAKLASNSATDPKIGSRSANPATAPSSNGPGVLTDWLSWITNRIKAISGTANWYDAPAISLATAKSNADTHRTASPIDHPDGSITNAKLAGSISADKLATGLLPPTGSVTSYAGTSAPTGWLLCDGTAISRTTYAALFAVINTTYGIGDGGTTFNLPNLKGRVLVGRDAGQSEFDTLGKAGGAKTHTLATSELPSHNHPVTDPTHAHGDGTLATDSDGAHTHNVQANPAGGSPSTQKLHAEANIGGVGDTTISNAALSNGAHSHDVTGWTSPAVTGITIGNTGSGNAHNNLQPYLVLNFIIKT